MARLVRRVRDETQSHGTGLARRTGPVPRHGYLQVFASVEASHRHRRAACCRARGATIGVWDETRVVLASG